MRGPKVGRPGGPGGAGTLGAGNGYLGKAAGAGPTLFPPEPTRSSHCDPTKLIQQAGTLAAGRARSTGKGLKRFLKSSTMSSDAKEAKTFNGDKKEDWKGFYDEAVNMDNQIMPWICKVIGISSRNFHVHQWTMTCRLLRK